MRPSVTNILAFALNGVALARRSVRTWFFVVSAVGSGFALYHFFAPMHVFGQSSAPRFSTPAFGALTLFVLLLGVIFLTFDLRHRDSRERLGEALSARPFSNLDFLLGHLVAVVVITWLAVIALALALQAFGFAVASLDYRLFGEPPEPVALAAFVLLDAPVSLAFWGALVMLLDSILRLRVLVVGVAMSLLVLHFVLLFQSPLFLLPSLSGITALGLPGSDILPRVPQPADYVQRGAVLALTFGALLLAAAFTARPQASGRAAILYGTYGAALVVAGCAAISLLVWTEFSERNERREWTVAHAFEASAAHPDLERLTGEVRIQPGRKLDIAVDLHVVANEALPVLTFSLNPGMHITEVRLDGGDTSHSHSLGLLRIALAEPLATGARALVRIEASGIPDPRFAYLGSAMEPSARSLLDSPLVLLGEQSSLFEADYLALMPDTRWLPSPGANSGRNDPLGRSPDFHHVDLAVSLPSGWLPAGPGRQSASPPWRFLTTAPITEYALIAAPFARRALRVAGVDCELLLHPAHMRQFDAVADALPEAAIADYLSERLAVPGLHYPHDTLSLVETPAQLRRYGGGWRMGTLQALDGVQMLPEHGFPTAPFAARYPAPNLRSDPDHGHSTMLARLDRLGPNGIPLSAGFSRNLLPALTSATGEGALTVNYLLEALTARHALGVHEIAPGGWVHASVPANNAVARAVLRAMGTATVRSAWFDYMPDALETRSETTPLKDVDPRVFPDGADILFHKGERVAAMIEGVLGRRKTGEFLALVRRRHAGRTFMVDDFVNALATTEPSLRPLIEHFLNAASLPGYLASPVLVVRIDDDENGRPRHQIVLHVRNDEPVPGVVALTWRTETQDLSQWHVGPHATVLGNASVQMGAVSTNVPQEIRLETYLALNRRALQLPVSNDAMVAVDQQPFVGARPSDWAPRGPGIVVDDLDHGFSVAAATTGLVPWRRLQPLPSADVPEFGALRDGWRRQSSPDVLAWGKYRRTLVRKPAGDGSAVAHFDAIIPAAGHWNLQYHLPGASLRYVRYGRLRRPESIGDIHMTLLRGEREPVSLALDAGGVHGGWNEIGTFEIPAGPVRLTVSDRTTGDIIVADAIRWRRTGADHHQP